MNDFYSTAEWIMGDGAQREWARFVAGTGMVVLPTYVMSDQAAENKAPVLLTAEGTLTAPDLLVTGIQAETRWHEVKAKSRPTWRRCSPGPRWEHGCDWCLAMEYQQVEAETGFSVFIIVHEDASPLDMQKESKLEGPEAWLSIRLEKALKVGQHRTDWPGGRAQPWRRGKRKMGGLLWDRSQMQQVQR
jgi:hypothetical protein